MCFSATASFGAAAVLGTIGAVSLKKVVKPSEIAFAGLPLLFAIQQVSEGILWISLSNDAYLNWKTSATYFFLFFAQFLWPFFIPLSLYLIEQNQRRKKQLFAILIAGLSCSVVLGYRLLFYRVDVGIEHHHIRYDIGSSKFIIVLSSILYIIAIIFPFFVSGLKGIKLLGTILVISLVVTELFYTNFLISVWCFFAAVLSLIIIYILSLLHKEEALREPLHHSHG